MNLGEQSALNSILEEIQVVGAQVQNLNARIALIEGKTDSAVSLANSAWSESMQKPSFDDLMREISSNVPEEIRGASIAGFGDTLIKDGTSASWGYVPEGTGGPSAYSGPFTASVDATTGEVTLSEGLVYLRDASGVGYSKITVNGSATNVVIAVITDFSAGTATVEGAATPELVFALATSSKAAKIIAIRDGVTPNFTVAQEWIGGNIWYDRD